jgi:hypothetical protein
MAGQKRSSCKDQKKGESARNSLEHIPFSLERVH